MSDETPLLSTWDVLHELGFVDVPKEYALERVATTVGSLILFASQMMTFHGEKVVVSGNYKGRNSMALIEYFLPVEIVSKELCAASLAYNLKEVLEDHDFAQVPEQHWYRLGLANQELLPWVAKTTPHTQTPNPSSKLHQPTLFDL